MSTAVEKKIKRFKEQKKFLKSFTGTILVDDMLIRMGSGRVVDAEDAEKGVKADIEVHGAQYWFKNPSQKWAKNPKLLDEMIERCIRIAKDMV